MDHSCIVLLWLADSLPFELIFQRAHLLVELWVEWTGGSVFELPLFREWLQYFEWVLRTIVADYLTCYSMMCKSRFDVGDDRFTFGVWQFGYLKKKKRGWQSTIMRYFDLSQVNRSVATFSQGLLGNWEGIIGSFGFCFWCCWHILHLAIFSWISELIPGHYNTSRALLSHLSLISALVLS